MRDRRKLPEIPFHVSIPHPRILTEQPLSEQPLGDHRVQSHVHSPGVSLADGVNISKQATEATGNTLFTWAFPV